MGVDETSVAKRLKTAVKRWGSVRKFQREMSEAGVKGSSYPQIHRYLAGKANPSLEFLQAAAEMLNVRMTWLVSAEGAMTQQVEDLRDVMWTGTEAGWDPETARQLREDCLLVNMEDSVRAAFLDLLTESIQVPGLEANTPEQIVRWAKVLDTLVWAPVDALYPGALTPSAEALRYYALASIVALRHLVQDRSLEGLRSRPGLDLDPDDIETLRDALRRLRREPPGDDAVKPGDNEQ